MKYTIKILLLILLCLQVRQAVPAQSAIKITTEEYILTYKDDAISDMIYTGVPASITLAQGILESQSGNSRLAREANNHFGIKCHSDWKGKKIYKDDDKKHECFRKYPNVMASYIDHSRFLRERQRYAFLFDYKTTDYKAWAKGLKKAGYATNPKYADHLIRLIEQHKLHQYDKGGKKVSLDKKLTYNNTIPKSNPIIPKPTANDNIQLNSNDVPFVIAGKGDTYFSIAARNDMRLWQVLKYNEASKNDILHVGAIIYLKPKRGKATSATHTVKKGESIRDIAQHYGVKSRRIYKKNKLEPGSGIEVGMILKLR
jgi:LysM repeat protein